MHEHGLVDRLLDHAQQEAARRGGSLRVVRVRLGALYASPPEHFRADFAHVAEERQLTGVELELELAPERPSGLELRSIEIAPRPGCTPSR